MKTFEVLLAKSWQAESVEEQAPDYARLVAHLQAVELAGSSIVEVVGELILEQLDLPPDEWLSRLSRALKVACLSHDLGKANEGFQEMVTGQRHPTQQPARHELLSALLLEDKTSPFRAWALEMLKVGEEDEAGMLLDCVIGAVAGHHLKMDMNWQKAMLALRGGCGLKLDMLLTHPDMQNIFKGRLSEEVRFSLVKDEANYLGSRQLRFNVNSNRWCARLMKDADWWRFAAAIKALLMAADVAGSAMAPAGEDIQRWVHATLSQRVKPEQMKEVVSARLRGAEPRPFQNAIGQSRERVTLVEAGCGTGKTAAAYMWAEHHAKHKKLRLAQAIARRLFPVKSSAPATTTRTSPRQKLKPPSKRVTPKPRPALVTTTVKKRAPSEINAPASIASTTSVTVSVCAFTTPRRSTMRAISRGG